MQTAIPGTEFITRLNSGVSTSFWCDRCKRYVAATNIWASGKLHPACPFCVREDAGADNLLKPLCAIDISAEATQVGNTWQCPLCNSTRETYDALLAHLEWGEHKEDLRDAGVEFPQRAIVHSSRQGTVMCRDSSCANYATMQCDICHNHFCYEHVTDFGGQSGCFKCIAG